LLDGEQLARNLAQDHAEIALFLEYAHAEPRKFSEGEPEISAATFTDVLDMIFRSDAAHQFLGVLGLEGRPFDAVQDAVEANDGRHSDPEVQVRRSL
jgi:hypothetical protein